MTAPIVHIGFHKTATAWLQQTIFPLVTGHDPAATRTTLSRWMRK